MTANLSRGMDHDLYAWSPLGSRPPLIWASGAPVALVVLVDVSTVLAEDMATAPAKGMVAGLLGPRPFPDIPRTTQRQYGHRVGIFRVISALKNAGVPVTVSLDALTATDYRYVTDYCVEQSDELIAGGLSGSNIITSLMSIEDQAVYIDRTLATLESATGSRPRGWVSPEYSQSADTTRLLSDAGLDFVCDWVNDEQPYPLTVGEHDMYSVPITYELDDVNVLMQRRVDILSYERMLGDALECLAEDGTDNARMLVLRIRPWLMGQPFRIAVLERFLELAMSSGHVWATTPSSIVTEARRAYATA